MKYSGISQKKIIKSNPAVDPDQLGEVIKIMKELKKQGIESEGYHISSPFTHQPTQFENSEKNTLISRFRKQ